MESRPLNLISWVSQPCETGDLVQRMAGSSIMLWWVAVLGWDVGRPFLGNEQKHNVHNDGAILGHILASYDTNFREEGGNSSAGNKAYETVQNFRVAGRAHDWNQEKEREIMRQPCSWVEVTLEVLQVLSLLGALRHRGIHVIFQTRQKSLQSQKQNSMSFNHDAWRIVLTSRHKVLCIHVTERKNGQG